MNLRRTTPRIAFAAIALVLGPAARACSVCGCGDPLLIASDPAALTGRLRLQLDAEYVRVDAGTDGRPGFTDRLTQWSYRLNAAFRPLDSLALSLTVPYVTKKIETTGGGTRTVSSDLSGAGDAEVASRLSVWHAVDLGKARTQELAVTGGTGLPTGKKDARGADGALVDPHGQLGTGAFSPFAGLSYVFQQHEWLLFANVSGRLRGEASYFDGSRYKFGDALLWSAHAQLLTIPRVVLDLGVDGRHARADRATDPNGTVTAAVENTGGTVLSVAPGLYVNPVDGLWVFARGQVPFVKHLFGQQDVLPTVTAGLQIELF